MAEITLEMSQSQRQASDKQPRVESERNKKANQFRVKIDTRYYGWFADTASNRKAVLVFLREMYDRETGKGVFTEEEVAGLGGSPNRQAVDGHMKGFRDADGQILEFLKHQRKVDDEVVPFVWQVFCSDPYASLSVMVAQANTSYRGEKPLTAAKIREALSQIGGDTVWREILTGLEQGKAHYAEAYLLERLFSRLDDQCAAVEPMSILAEGLDVLEIQGSEAMESPWPPGFVCQSLFESRSSPCFPGQAMGGVYSSSSWRSGKVR